jgi:DNA-binding GntR family transcriptional regulator
MTGLIDRNDRRHVYQQAADLIRDRIRSGYYSPGQELPSMANMGKEFGISELTMERAFYQLRDQGWLVVRQGYSTRVADRPPHTENAKANLLELAHQAQEALAKLTQAIEAMPDRP